MFSIIPKRGILCFIAFIISIHNFGFSRIVKASEIVMQTIFTSNRQLLGEYNLNFKNHPGLVPLSINYIDDNGRIIAIPVSIRNGNLHFDIKPSSTNIRQLVLLYESPVPLYAINDIEILSGDLTLNGDWSLPSICVADSLTDVADTLSSYTVGSPSIHAVTFTTSNISIADTGMIWVTFPANFNLDSVAFASYFDNDPLNDLNEPIIISIDNAGSTLLFHLNGGSQQAMPRSKIKVQFWTVFNDTLTGPKSVIVQTTTKHSEVVHWPRSSQQFILEPGPLTDIDITPETNISVPSDSAIIFTASGYDAYKNVIDGLSFIYDVTVDSCGSVSNGLFRALKIGTCYVTAFYGGVFDSSGIITVIPGNLHHFTLSGAPANVTAGTNFPAPVFVTAIDINNNRKYNYNGTVTFISNDPSPTLPSSYHYIAADSGRHSFPGTSFILRTSGTRTISVVDAPVMTASAPISVAPGPITTFNLIASSPQTAGDPFDLQALDARDAFNNLAPGEILITDSLGDGISPDGMPPSLNRIIVGINGSGSAQQILTNAVPTILRGTVSGGGAEAYTGVITVLPAGLGRFTLSGYPDSLTAGSNFPAPLSVAGYDIFGNLKVNYTGTVSFSSTDPQALLPLPYQFVVLDSGTHNFSGPISLRSAGPRTITIVDGSVSRSTGNILVNAAPISSFLISAPPVVTAGASFNLTVSGAVDSWNNPAGGIIVISDSIGGGSSPDGYSPVYSSINVNMGTGFSGQITYHSIPTRLKGTILENGVFAVTDLFDVNPGALGRFNMQGQPSNIIAGAIFTNIIVTAYDQLGNLKYDYLGDVFFTSSDPQAILPYSSSSPYSFVPGDQGIHNFIDNFSLRTSGNQTISITDGDPIFQSPIIVVSPATTNSFNLIAPSEIEAGIPFALIVNNAQDRFGNPVSGVVTVTDSIGGGQSPGGFTPIFNSIQVISGNGSASQTLYNAVITVLSGRLDNLMNVTDSINIMPYLLGRFDLNISSPQLSGAPFEPPSTITAYDYFGNLKVNFNAAQDSVVIISPTGGEVTNNVLNSASDFINGTADLSAQNTTYWGGGGERTFQAQSESGIIALSNPVIINAMDIMSVTINEGIITEGDTLTGIIHVVNGGGVSGDVTDFELLGQRGWSLNPESTVPPLPNTLEPGLDRNYTINVIIPEGFSYIGANPVSANMRGIFGSQVIVDTVAGFPDTVEIQTNSQLFYLDNTIAPETVSTAGIYEFNFRLGNSGGSGFGLLDSSYMTFSDGSHQFRANVFSGYYIPPNQPQGIIIAFDSTLIDPAFAPGSFFPTFNYYGIENGRYLSGIVSIANAITVQSDAFIDYVNETLSPRRVVQGQTAAFAVRVNNAGLAGLSLDPSNTFLAIQSANQNYQAFIDTSINFRISIINPGDTTIHFSPVMIPPDFIAANYGPHITVRGLQNGRPALFEFDANSDSTAILSRNYLRIDSTYSLALNAPYVNTTQACSVKVIIENLGFEGVDSLNLNLASDGQSVFSTPVTVNIPEGISLTSHIFNIVSATAPDSAELFASSLSGGIGNISRTAAGIAQPLDNSALLITEIPALLALQPINIIGPPEAFDDTVSIGQSVTLGTSVLNLGQASITGGQQLVLETGNSGFTVIGSPIMDYQLGEDVIWNLMAPDYPIGSAILTIRFVSYPVDLNDGRSAVGPDSLRQIEFVVNTYPVISQQPYIAGPQGVLDHTVSTNQTFTIADSLNLGGYYTNLTSKILLPNGFTTPDSVVKYPGESHVSWIIRAPGFATADSIGIISWLFDMNTGDSIGVGPHFINLQIQTSAALRLSSRISGPESAFDGIVEPGSQLTYEALVANEGQADVGSGQIWLETGHPQLIPEESAIRDFNVGIPVVWTITVPDTEISSPILIWTTISTVPIEQNTMLPSNVLVDSSSTNIVIRELLPRLALTDLDEHSGSMVKGQAVRFLTFAVQNNDRGGRQSIGITGMQFELISNPVFEPGQIFSNFVLAYGIDTIPAANMSQSTIDFVLPDTLILDPLAGYEFSIILSLSQATAVSDFRLAFGSNPITAVAIQDGIPTVSLALLTTRGEPVTWMSRPTAVLEPSFTASLSSYPNPFNPRVKAANIGYFLETDSNIEIKIYTLTGDLVWSRNILASEDLGRAGLHTENSAIAWDGKNNQGFEVRSGVYICAIKNLSSGEEKKLKIAVVK